MNTMAKTPCSVYLFISIFGQNSKLRNMPFQIKNNENMKLDFSWKIPDKV